MVLERTAAKLVTVAAAFHAAADQIDEAEGIEPYCAACGAWIGIFYGLTGWRHFRGDPAPGGQRELYEAGHQAAPGFCQPPGRVLSPVQTRVVCDALTDAIGYRLDRAGSGCADCERDPAGACPDHVADTARALSYRQLFAALADRLPELPAVTPPGAVHRAAPDPGEDPHEHH